MGQAPDMEAFWDMRPGDTQDRWLIEPGALIAHLFAYASPDDDPELPRCGAPSRRSATRPAVHGDQRCGQCDDWYLANVYLPQIA